MRRANHSRHGLRVARWLTASFLVIAAGSLAAQPETPPFGPARGGSKQSEQPRWLQAAQSLERRFFETDAWTFYYDIRDLPSDMQALLSRVAGTNVVGPGEEFYAGDIVERPQGRTQHLYTAVTDEIGVIVWYSGGWALVARAVLYDRNTGDACRYDLGEKAVGVLPIKPVLRMWIETRGLDQGGCEYLTFEPSDATER